MSFLELRQAPGVYSRVTAGMAIETRVCSAKSGLLSRYDRHLGNLKYAWLENKDASGYDDCQVVCSAGKVFSPISLSMSRAHPGQDKADETQQGQLRFYSPSPTEACLNPETPYKVSSLNQHLVHSFSASLRCYLCNFLNLSFLICKMGTMKPASQTKVSVVQNQCGKLLVNCKMFVGCQLTMSS